MTQVHPALRPELVARLREELGSSDGPGMVPHVGGAGGGGAGSPLVGASPAQRLRRRVEAGVKSAARRLIRRSLGWYVEAQVQERVDRVARELEPGVPSGDDVRAQSVNLELLKGEVRALLDAIDELDRRLGHVEASIAADSTNAPPEPPSVTATPPPA